MTAPPRQERSLSCRAASYNSKEKGARRKRILRNERTPDVKIRPQRTFRVGPEFNRHALLSRTPVSLAPADRLSVFFPSFFLILLELPAGGYFPPCAAGEREGEPRR